MSWTEKDMDEAERIYMRERPRGYPIRGVLNELMTFAMESFLARASGRVKEDVECVRSVLGAFYGKAEPHQALSRLSALAQEAESFRAKADDWKEKHDILQHNAHVVDASLRGKVEGLAQQLKAEQEESAKLRAALAIVRTDTEGVWRWQGEGDQPESLTCPVVMSADTLRGLLASADSLRTDLDIAGAFLRAQENRLAIPEQSLPWAERWERLRVYLARPPRPSSETVECVIKEADERAAEEGLRAYRYRADSEEKTDTIETLLQERDTLRAEVERLTGNYNSLFREMEECEDREKDLEARIKAADTLISQIYDHYSPEEIEKANPTSQLGHWRDGLKALRSSEPQKPNIPDPPWRDVRRKSFGVRGQLRPPDHCTCEDKGLCDWCASELLPP